MKVFSDSFVEKIIFDGKKAIGIEVKIKNKKNKSEVPVIEFRRECRAFAENWINVHKDQFKRLGVVGDWENYYSTMSYDAEAQIVRELGKFLNEGR